MTKTKVLPVIHSVPARRSAQGQIPFPTPLIVAGVFSTIVYLMLSRAYAAPSGAQEGALSPWAILWQWTPTILHGFVSNIAISLSAAVLATVLGLFVGIGLISHNRLIRSACWFFTHFFRNAPWLVILFYCMLMLPFQLNVFGTSVAIPDWFKAVLGIAIAASANMAEVVRGAIQSIPTGQWESADSLAFNRRQTIWMIILPQCLRKMLPGWMNLYALIMVSTPLCSIVGVGEVMTTVTDMLASYNRPELLLPAYFYLLVLFFSFCFPIAMLTRRLGRRFATAG